MQRTEKTDINLKKKKEYIITLGDLSIIKPSSTALSSKVWTPPEGIVLVRATGGDDVSATEWAVTGAGGGGCGDALCSVISLVTFNWNPPS